MLTASHDADGLRIAASAYRLWFRSDRPYAVLDDVAGRRWSDLCLATSVDAIHALDDTARLDAPEVEPDAEGVTVTLRARSSAWAARRLVLRCRDDHLALRVEVEGAGRLTDVRLLGGHISAYPRWGSGFHASTTGFRSLVSPEVTVPDRISAAASEAATIDVLGSSLPGRGRWFFTPPPFALAVSRAPAVAGMALPEGPWMTLALVSPVAEQTFTGLHYEPGESTFSLRLAYEGETAVDGAWSSPWLSFTFGAPDPYAGIAAAGDLARGLGLAPSPERRPATWWAEPIFCGWGQQCHLALTGRAEGPTDVATQESYNRFLGELAARGVDPGIVVIDDRWERAYGTGEADAGRWPDLRGWIAARHAEGRHVLLWWKAWDPSGTDPELCVRNASGLPVAVDPSNPAYAEVLRAAIRRMLGPDGYDADGLKVDFTAMTPSGPGMRRHGREWGAALLHRLLKVIHAEAKAAKPDALVMTHTPNPAFADVTDMIRLNDVQRLDQPSPGAPFVEHMVHRAAIARSGLPDVLIDTDNWAMPDRATWRRYLDLQPELGVPSLYYTTHIDRSGEPLTGDDYAALRDAWARHRARLPRP